MSRKYKYLDGQSLYFVSFATANWVDLFVRVEYMEEMAANLAHCRRAKGMELYAWCLMPSHVHLLFRAQDGKPAELIRDLKTYSSRRLRQMIAESQQESRREWLLRAFAKPDGSGRLWQPHNHPIELWSAPVIDQKAEYVHRNPVVAGFVAEPCHWQYSSAIDYSGGKGVIEIDYLDG